MIVSVTRGAAEPRPEVGRSAARLPSNLDLLEEAAFRRLERIECDEYRECSISADGMGKALQKVPALALVARCEHIRRCECA